MPISLKTIKMLWGRSGNRCAICRKELVLDPIETDDPESVVGDMAHIVARKDGFTRGDYDSLPAEQRDRYANLLLLCKIHHKQIDDQPNYFTIEKLRDIKTAHEAWVKEQLSPDDVARRGEEELYAACIEELLGRIKIDEWTARGTWICSGSGPQMTTSYRDALQQVGPWLLGRIWPGRYPNLERAVNNFSNILSDFLTVFHRHSEQMRDNEWLETTRFYRSVWVEQDEYHRRLRRYEEHTALVEDLFMELTRGLNYICDFVRQDIIPSFRLREGAVLVERGPVSMRMQIEHIRPEYRGTERSAEPYPGLQAFIIERYSRDAFVRRDDEGD